MDHRKDISEIATGTKRWAVSGHCKCTSIKRPTKKLTLRWSC